jgi:hypothetical protein
LCCALVSAGEKALMKAAMDGNLVRLKGTPFSFSSSPPHPWPIFFLNLGVQPVPVYYHWDAT